MNCMADKDAGQIGPGALVAIVGPSGAGKDTLIRVVQSDIGSDPRFHFVRRLVTRTAAPEAEDHDTIDPAAFELMVEEGRCALSWRAHGLGYALPLSLDEAVAAGRIAVANLSRAAIDDARRRYSSCLVVEVTAPRDVLFQRLSGRGRETAEEIRHRLDRAAATAITGIVVQIDNSGPLVLAQVRLRDILFGLAAAGPDER